MQTLAQKRLRVVALAGVVALGCQTTSTPQHARDGAAGPQLSPSANPPAGLVPAQVPQFVSVSFDDNFNPAGMEWATGYLQDKTNPAGLGNSATFDGALVRTTFYHTSGYLAGDARAWNAATKAGHEVGDHTVGHPLGLTFTLAQWTPQVRDCRAQLAGGLGIAPASISGFRAPYLGYNDALYTSLAAESPAFVYDTSIQSCWGASEDGTNCSWPYTLDGGSPDAANVLAKFGSGLAAAVRAHAGLWEVPVTTLIVPPDAAATECGFAPGLRTRVEAALIGAPRPSFYDPSTGRISGLDITLLVDAKMTKAEALATLKYTLDLHLSGNRSPLVFVAHTHVYARGYDSAPNVLATADRRAVVEEFIRYALTKPDVRMRPEADIVAWMAAPQALGVHR